MEHDNPILKDLDRAGGIAPRPGKKFAEEMAEKMLNLNARIIALENENARLRRALQEAGIELPPDKLSEE